MSEAKPGLPEFAEGLEDGEVVVIEAEDSDPIRGQIVRVKRGGDPPGGYCSVVVEESTNRKSMFSGPMYDAESTFDPRSGWSDPEVFERDESTSTTEHVSLGPLERIESSGDLGIKPERLSAGLTVRHWSGHRYRVVVPPWEREYDNKALAYDLDNSSNACKRIESEELVEVVDHPLRRENDA